MKRYADLHLKIKQKIFITQDFLFKSMRREIIVRGQSWGWHLPKY
jgi:hypothetical protein